MNKSDRIEVLSMIAEDAEKDIHEFEGKVLNGPNIAEFNGKQNAMIQGLAKMLKEIIQDTEENNKDGHYTEADYQTWLNEGR